MGNENSKPVGLEIDEKPVLTNTSYAVYNAVFGLDTERKITVFSGVLNNKYTVDKLSKNVMIHRHPNIIKYVASWKSGEKYFLATEEVEPLINVIDKLTSLQICVGLNSVLKGVVFLHEKALSSHNNLCRSSIYVTPEGQWRLGGLEFLCRFDDLSAKFLEESKIGRYDRICEDEKVPNPPSSIDKYAFGILVDEVLTSRIDENVPGSLDFLHIAKSQLQSSVPSDRPSLQTLLKHPFFNHEFIAIYNFLTELPLKTEEEKQLFFRELTLKLSEFGEEIVAGQLGALLLSRIVLLDTTAQKHLLPQILNPRLSDDSSNLFTEECFKTYIVPKLMSIFCVRDIQVRLILLTYFKSFCTIFTVAQLNAILPELLVGVKDTNDDLVSGTLRALSDLVSILGAEKVIGGKRAKHFSDGRPKVHVSTKGIKKKNVQNGLIENSGEHMFLCERPSPDGGEAPIQKAVFGDEVEQWDSWDTSPVQMDEVLPIIEPLPTIEAPIIEKPLDINTIEIKKRPSVQQEDEIDFFRDMEPVISKTQIIQITETPLKTDRLSYQDEEIEGEGWGEDGLEWAEVDDS